MPIPWLWVPKGTDCDCECDSVGSCPDLCDGTMGDQLVTLAGIVTTPSCAACDDVNGAYVVDQPGATGCAKSIAMNSDCQGGFFPYYWEPTSMIVEWGGGPGSYQVVCSIYSSSGVGLLVARFLKSLAVKQSCNYIGNVPLIYENPAALCDYSGATCDFG